jgi:hypothetical protein
MANSLHSWTHADAYCAQLPMALPVPQLAVGILWWTVQSMTHGSIIPQVHLSAIYSCQEHLNKPDIINLGCWAPPGIRALGVSAGGGGAVGLRNLARLVAVYGQPVDFALLSTKTKPWVCDKPAGFAKPRVSHAKSPDRQLILPCRVALAPGGARHGANI